MADTIHASPLAALFDAKPAARRPSLRALFGLWAFRWESRRALAAMDSARLADIGVTAGEAAREAAKPFWRA
jgi:uncharacterized protein YjiS (DUF1127 family)